MHMYMYMHLYLSVYVYVYVYMYVCMCVCMYKKALSFVGRVALFPLYKKKHSPVVGGKLCSIVAILCAPLSVTWHIALRLIEMRYIESCALAMLPCHHFLVTKLPGTVHSFHLTSLHCFNA